MKNEGMFKILVNSRKFHIAIILLIVCALLWAWFKPLALLGGDWQYLPSSLVDGYFDKPFAWDSHRDGGFSTLFYGKLSKYPLFFVSGFLMEIFPVTFNGVVTRLLWCLPFILVSVFGMYFLSHNLFKDRTVSFVSTIFYTINPIILERLYRSQFEMATAYAFIPLILLLSIHALRVSGFQRFRQSIILGIIFSLSFYFDIRMSILGWVFVFLYMCFYIWQGRNNLKEVLFSCLTILFVSGMIILCLHSFWIGPFLLDAGSNLHGREGLIANLTDGSIGYYSGTFIQNLLFIPKAWEAKSLFFVNALLSLLVFLGAFWSRKNKLVLFLFVVALILVFLGKGSYPPFPNFHEWLATHVPLYSMYRVSNKFTMLSALPYSLLLGLSVSHIINNLLNKGKKR